MRRRSRTVALTILGASAFALAGCREEPIDAQAYPDLASCKAAADEGGGLLLNPADCDQAFAEAQTLHEESAPRYDSQAVCEEQHGAGACGPERAVVGEGGSGSIFMPLLAGYLIGNMMAGRGGMAAAQPMYRTSDGRFANATGSNTYSSNSGKAKLSPASFARPPATMGKPAMTRAMATSRGGFGSAGARGVGG